MTRSNPKSGQILVVFAGGLIGLIALAALAIDISTVYSIQRLEHDSADAAALAGAQDLQIPGTRTVDAIAYATARGHALQNLVSKLGGTGVPSCPPDTNGNISDCAIPGTPYLVSVKTWTSTWSPTTVNVDPAHAVLVTIRQPSVSLTFARLFGQDNWNIAQSSVAGLGYGRAYAIETLRPPKKNGSTFLVNDIDLDGGTVVNVQHGDVGTNANMDYSGSGTIMNIDSGYGIYYFDPYFTPQWYPSAPKPPNQIVKQINTLITDPNYRYPVMAGSRGTAPTWDDARTSIAGAGAAVQRASVDAACAAEVAKVDVTKYTFMSTQPLSNVYCYNEGTYQSGSGAKNATITVSSGDVALLKPGVYYLKSGLDVSGRLLGGYEPGQPGVALMFDETGPGNCSGCVFSGNNALTIALNSGTRFPPSSASGTPAKAAIDWNNQKVETSGPSSPTPPLLLTLLVNKDPDCVVPTSPPYLEPTACNANKNKTLNMAGGGSLAVEGVQYAPTDNVEIHGGSSGYGRIGQIIAWTLFYSGGTHINQEGPPSERPGILYLDGACSGGRTPCAP